MRNTSLKRSSVLLLALCLPAACDDRTFSHGADAGGDGAVYQPPPLMAEGSYALTSPIDLTALALAPEAATKNILLLKGLRDDPAGTFIKVLDEAGIPLVNDLYGVLPGPLKDKVSGWINEAILGKSFQGRPVSDELSELLALAEATLVRFDLLTDLTLPAPGAVSDAGLPPLATHTFRGIKYDFLGGRLPVEIPRLVDKHTPVNAETQATARTTIPGSKSDGDLELGDHSFGVPYGEYAFAAINQATHQRYGAPLRGALGKLIDCPAMAESVGNKCVSLVVDKFCVEHKTELQAICDRGLDKVVEKIQEGIQSYNFNAVRFRKGQAQLWDAPTAAGARDGRADRLAEGSWEALIDAGMGPREVRASFTGTRR